MVNDGVNILGRKEARIKAKSVDRNRTTKEEERKKRNVVTRKEKSGRRSGKKRRTQTLGLTKQ